jgi:hypothetical protein
MGLRAPAVPAARIGAADSGNGVKIARPFRAKLHREEDLQILRIGSTSPEEVIDLGTHVQEAELSDFWYWQHEGVEKDAMNVAFPLGLEPAAGAAEARVTLNLKGVTNNPNADPDHHLKFILNGHDISLVGGVANDAIWEGQNSYTWKSAPLDPEVLNSDGNVLVIQKVNDLKTGDGHPLEQQDAYLNFIELEFPSTYAVRGNRIAFSNDFPDSAGLTRFTLKGFSGPSVSLWDARGRKLTGYSPAPLGGGGYAVSFLDSLNGPASYVAAALDAREAPPVRLDTLAELVSPSEGADYLLITQKELLGSALDSLLDFRRAQGLRCKVVMADHIYQAFGDGSMDPAAIRAFVAHAYRAWPRPAPAYLLLLGDASVWFDKISSPFLKTIVPTHLVNIRGWGVAADDDYFAKVSGDDDVADLFVGRIPVQSREDLSKVVRKTLALEKDRPQGHWSNQALLIGGFEPSFTKMNDDLQSIAVASGRQFSRIDLYPTSPYYKSLDQRAGFFDQMDSAFNLVSFVGHGGGAVWSDDGILTLKHLDEGRLQGKYPVPLVASITCLTGYFEDINARSLGEEMVRLDRAGAGAFYGAAGYISNVAGAALSSEVLRAAAGAGGTTVGAVVRQAETMVQLRTGDAFLPILAEFNLLGDPALTLAYPAAQGNLDITPEALAGKSSMDVKGRGLSPDGEGVLTVYLGDSAESADPVTVTGGTFSFRHGFSAPAGPSLNGKALLHYWSGKESHIASAPFTFLDWLIDSVAIEPADAAPGDSARIRFRLATAYAKTVLTGGIVSYAVGGETAPLFPAENQALLRGDDGVHYETVNKVALPPPSEATPHPKLHVAFRMSLQGLNENGDTVKTLSNVSSRIYALPLSDLAKLSLHEVPFRMPIQENAGVWVVFTNHGLGAAKGFHVELTLDAGGPAPVVRIMNYRKQLPFGGVDSLFDGLVDSLLNGKLLRAAIVPAKPGELAAEGTTRDTVFHVLTKAIGAAADSLPVDTSGVFVTLQSGAAAHRVFAEKVAVTSLPPHLSPPSGALPMIAYRIRSTLTKSLTVGTKSTAGALAKKAAAAKAAEASAPCWHYQDASSQTWLKLDTAGPLSAFAFRDGLYALLVNGDAAPPAIQLSSRGQALLPDDYVPLNTPINITLRDGQGIDLALHPPLVKSLQQSPDSASGASETEPPFPLLARISFLPKHKASRDSLEIIARDVSGNETKKVVAYRLGDDLSIRNLGSYPNPFADTAVFVYSLTDYCDQVDLKIYSRAGRLVRSLAERNVVGYREVPWDGLSDEGHEIANGLYFLKVTAKAGGNESSRIFKLFKKKRK